MLTTDKPDPRAVELDAGDEEGVTLIHKAVRNPQTPGLTAGVGARQGIPWNIEHTTHSQVCPLPNRPAVTEK